MNYVDLINEAIETILTSHVEYETEHVDAGDAYSHLPREGGWMYHNGLDRLKAWMVENDITTTLDDETLEELVLDNLEMETGHSLTSPSGDTFSIDRFGVEEVECEISFTELSEMTGLNITEGRMKAIAAARGAHCMTIGNDSLLAYEVTDSTWDAVIHANDLIELLTEAEE